MYIGIRNREKKVIISKKGEERKARDRFTEEGGGCLRCVFKIIQELARWKEFQAEGTAGAKHRGRDNRMPSKSIKHFNMDREYDTCWKAS